MRENRAEGSGISKGRLTAERGEKGGESRGRIRAEERSRV